VLVARVLPLVLDDPLKVVELLPMPKQAVRYELKQAVVARFPKNSMIPQGSREI